MFSFEIKEVDIDIIKMDEPDSGKLGIQEDEEAKKIMAGFKINSMRLRGILALI